MNTLLLLNNNQMGVGDSLLGQRVLKTFLQKSVSLSNGLGIAFYNSGVKLVATGSPVLGELQMLYDRGVEFFPCGTCIQHYGCSLAVGQISTMDEIIEAIGRADKVVTL